MPSFLLFWALGLGFLWWAVVPPLVWVAVSVRDKKAYLPVGTLLLLGLGAWLLISLVAGIMDGTADPAGVAGAAYSAVLWMCAGLLFAVITQASRPQLLQLLRGLVALVAVQGALTVVAVAAHPSSLDAIPLPAAGSLGSVSSLAPWTTASLAHPAFFGDLVTRSAGLMGAAAWSGGFAAIAMLLMMVNRRNLIVAGMRPMWWLIAFALAGCSLYFSYSRLSLVIAAIFGGYYLFQMAAARIMPKGGTLLATLATLVVLVFAAVFAPWQEYISEQDALRPGSSQTRFASYEGAVDAVMSAGVSSIFGGLGDKPSLGAAAFGAGSESTFFSLLVRGGLIAVALFVGFLMVRLRREVKNGDLGTVLTILALSVHAIAADFDVGTLTLLTAFISARRLRGEGRVWGKDRPSLRQKSRLRSVQPMRTYKNPPNSKREAARRAQASG